MEHLAWIVILYGWLGMAGAIYEIRKAYCEKEEITLTKKECLGILLWPICCAVFIVSAILYCLFSPFVHLPALVKGLFKE